MLFNSTEFLIFIAIVLPVYFVLNLKAQNVFLLVASYVFYGWWDWRFLLLIFASSCVDYLVSRAMNTAQGTYRLRLLQLSIVFNLGALATFKYFNFFIDSFIALGATVGLNLDTPALRLIPPVGISFYTFQTMSYSIDVYYRRIKPERSFLTFALFVSYFPQLVAGPIERASRLLPQLNQARRVSIDDLKSGLVLILVGLFKKVVIADNAGVRVDTIFSNPSQMSTVSLWAGALLFALQIYGDFSGYSNIARGTSRLLGIRLMENFKTPFFSKNIAEFWRRWHISLSEWLRDYLYIPLGGNRLGQWKTYRNLAATMLLGGLWHGAAWTFIAWGGLHGLYLMVHRYWQTIRPTPMPKPAHSLARTIIFDSLAMLLTLFAVVIAFVFFRVDTFSNGFHYLQGMFTWHGRIALSDILRVAGLAALILPLEIIQYRHDGYLLGIRKTSLFIRVPLYALMLIALLLTSNNEVPFIYFQF